MDIDEAYRIIKMPYVTEKTFSLIEKQNKMVFIVSDSATKSTIKAALRVIYDVKIAKVNVLRTPAGKKAYVTFTADSPASELASKIGVL
jgi:large subunit ribosomal protein L23